MKPTREQIIQLIIDTRNKTRQTLWLNFLLTILNSLLIACGCMYGLYWLIAIASILTFITGKKVLGSLFMLRQIKIAENQIKEIEE